MLDHCLRSERLGRLFALQTCGGLASPVLHQALAQPAVDRYVYKIKDGRYQNIGYVRC